MTGIVSSDASCESSSGVGRTALLSLGAASATSVSDASSFGVGGGAVANVHAHGLADPDPLTERDRARVTVGGDDRTHQKVAALVLGLVLVDHDAEHQA